MDPISVKDFEIAVGMPGYESALFIAFGHFLLKENRTVNWKNSGISGAYAIVINRKEHYHSLRLYQVDTLKRRPCSVVILEIRITSKLEVTQDPSVVTIYSIPIKIDVECIAGIAFVDTKAATKFISKMKTVLKLEAKNTSSTCTVIQSTFRVKGYDSVPLNQIPLEIANNNSKHDPGIQPPFTPQYSPPVTPLSMQSSYSSTSTPTTTTPSNVPPPLPPLPPLPASNIIPPLPKLPQSVNTATSTTTTSLPPPPPPPQLPLQPPPIQQQQQQQSSYNGGFDIPPVFPQVPPPIESPTPVMKIIPPPIVQDTPIRNTANINRNITNTTTNMVLPNQVPDFPLPPEQSHDVIITDDDDMPPSSLPPPPPPPPLPSSRPPITVKEDNDDLAKPLPPPIPPPVIDDDDNNDIPLSSPPPPPLPMSKPPELSIKPSSLPTPPPPPPPVPERKISKQTQQSDNNDNDDVVKPNKSLLAAIQGFNKSELKKATPITETTTSSVTDKRIPPSIGDAIKGFNKSKLKPVSTESRSNSIDKPNKTSPNNILESIQSFNKSKLKHVDTEDKTKLSPQKTETHSGCNSLVLEALQKRAKILKQDTNDDDW